MMTLFERLKKYLTKDNIPEKDNIPYPFQQRIQEAKEQQLEELDFSYELTIFRPRLDKIPDEVFELTHLKKLDLSNNNIQKIPSDIAKLTNLESLYLIKNKKLTKIPQELLQLPSLVSLRLTWNVNKPIPKWFRQIKQLGLHLIDKSEGESSRKIETILDYIVNLENLVFLELSINQLANLPESVTNLSNLTTLDLRDNQLTNLPESVTNLSNLTTLDLEGNPLEKPPVEVANQGIEAIRQYFRQIQEEGKDYIYEAKLLIVGEGGAGKTTLAKKIEDSNYILDSQEPSTEGIDITKWSFPFDNEREFKVNVWDFGGQEIYHATHQFFLTKRSLYALVVDTRREDPNFYYWLNVVELLSNNSPLIIVKNEKGDRTIEIDLNTLRGRFENLKESLPTNLATNRGLKEILAEIQHNICKLPHVGSALPKTWKRVRETLEEDKRNYISLEEYLNICEDNGFKQLKDKLQLSGYLHDLGVCLHFQDSPLLKNTVILKPEWGTDAVYKVLDDKQVINNLGRFTTEDLENIWSDEQYQFKQAELLELMMRFKLCYKIPQTNDTYIAPQLLTKTKPKYNWEETDNLILRYTYEFMPKGIITQLIVAMHECIYKQQYVWRSGVLLSKKNSLAEVIEDYDKREIKIRFVGKNKRDLLTIVTHELDKNHGSYPRLKYSQLIPCNCSICQNNQEPHFYKFEELQRFKEHRQLQIQCRNSFEMVNVLSLIDDVFTRQNSEGSDSTQNVPQSITKIEQHIHGNVGTLAGKFDGNQNVEKVQMEGNRTTNVPVKSDRKNPPNPNNMTTKILVLQSNSRGTNQLLLDQEIRDIEDAIRNASQRNLFSLKPQLAVRIQDLQPSILREKPRIVHFCGHGTGAKGLVVQTPSSESQLVNTSALANLFKQFSEQIECVILNACYSETQAQVIHQHINYVIGTTNAIKDSVAIVFSKGFYGALAEGRSIEPAFELGLNRIELEIDSTHHLERKLVPVDSGIEHQYSDRSGKLVLTLLKKEPLNKIINEPTEVETMPSQSNITINQGYYNQQTGNNNTMTNVTQTHSGSGDNVAGDKSVNQSRNVTISGGTINATGAGAFNLGDISGTVANTINQLPTSPDSEQPGIKELLTQLKEAIEAETDLDQTDKSDALEEVQNLAEASQDHDDNTKKTKAGKSLRMLGRITKALPATAAFMTICK